MKKKKRRRRGKRESVPVGSEIAKRRDGTESARKRRVYCKSYLTSWQVVTGELRLASFNDGVPLAPEKLIDKASSETAAMVRSGLANGRSLTRRHRYVLTIVTDEEGVLLRSLLQRIDETRVGHGQRR